MVFDNIDMNVKPRYMRGDFQTRSLHYVNTYAVKDRINFNQFSDDVPSNLCILDVIPSEEDYLSLKNDFILLIARIMVEYMAWNIDIWL